MSIKKQVRVYIDGENFTIALRKALAEYPSKDIHQNVDWISLAKSFLRPQQNEVLSKVTVFSVRYPKKSLASRAQSNYHKWLKEKGVELIYGQYKKRTRLCLNCNETVVQLEEKETDVNIALRMVIDAEDHKYDRAIIVSADTDLVPAMLMVKKRHSEKEIFVAIPPKTESQKGRSHEILKIADKVQSLKLARIKESLL